MSGFDGARYRGTEKDRNYYDDMGKNINIDTEWK